MARGNQTYTNDGAKTYNGINNNSYTNDSYTNRLKQATMSASQTSANNRGGMNGMFNPGTIAGRSSVGEIVNKPGTYGQGVQRVEAWRNANTSNTNNNTTYRSGGSGGGSSDGDGYSGSMGHAYVDDTLNKIRSLLEEQKNQADAYYKTLYEQQLASNKASWESNRNQINVNAKRAERYLDSMYGDAVSGQGLSNRVRNYANWNNNLAENQRNYTNNDATALASYNQGLANNASTLAQGWYNYILPIYTNRQQNIDDYDYRRYLASL